MFLCNPLFPGRWKAKLSPVDHKWQSLFDRRANRLQIASAKPISECLSVAGLYRTTSQGVYTHQSGGGND